MRYRESSQVPDVCIPLAIGNDERLLLEKVYAGPYVCPGDIQQVTDALPGYDWKNLLKDSGIPYRGVS